MRAVSSPSNLPESPESYSQTRAADDILSVLDHIAEKKAHIVGLSMGSFATLHFGLRLHDRALSLCVGGCRYGAELETRETFRSEADTIVNFIRSSRMQTFSERYSYGPTRVQFENKDSRGFAEFKQILSEHSAVGSANTQAGVQKERPSLYSLVDEENDGAHTYHFGRWRLAKFASRHSNETIDTFRGAFDYSKCRSCNQHRGAGRI
jgi:pimeloyl-ACP methyl ester carboxylesterase